MSLGLGRGRRRRMTLELLVGQVNDDEDDRGLEYLQLVRGREFAVVARLKEVAAATDGVGWYSMLAGKEMRRWPGGYRRAYSRCRYGFSGVAKGAYADFRCSATAW